MTHIKIVAFIILSGLSVFLPIRAWADTTASSSTSTNSTFCNEYLRISRGVGTLYTSRQQQSAALEEFLKQQYGFNIETLAQATASSTNPLDELKKNTEYMHFQMDLKECLTVNNLIPASLKKTTPTENATTTAAKLDDTVRLAALKKINDSALSIYLAYKHFPTHENSYQQRFMPLEFSDTTKYLYHILPNDAGFTLQTDFAFDEKQQLQNLFPVGLISACTPTAGRYCYMVTVAVKKAPAKENTQGGKQVPPVASTTQQRSDVLTEGQASIAATYGGTPFTIKVSGTYNLRSSCAETQYVLSYDDGDSKTYMSNACTPSKFTETHTYSKPRSYLVTIEVFTVSDGNWTHFIQAQSLVTVGKDGLIEAHATDPNVGKDGVVQKTGGVITNVYKAVQKGVSNIFSSISGLFSHSK